ncbi:WGR domain-containing protein [Geoalkalibacter subterraneus]|uniref:WGR domain-containing protein n=1 Tax=Geoalkalibacter subterraneus TaxID=483547 RepID=A0A0B5FX45_9BACT|nr:WGR domain-containing protein [Geoalkalibacter subterraneus]AJF08171.1 hypothetical protein GSUB_16855 [Geoalkalibacter subterraneus]
MVIAHLRFDNPDGSSKDWIIRRTSDGFATEWGRTGKALQSKNFPGKNFSNVDAEIQRRISEKYKKGYQDVVSSAPDDPAMKAVKKRVEQEAKAEAQKKAEKELAKISKIDSVFSNWF